MLLAMIVIICGLAVFATRSPAYLMPMSLAAAGLVTLVLLDIRRRAIRDAAKK
jgi:hypothetical protein